VFAALCVVVFAGVVAARTPEEDVALEAEFSAWTVEYGKTYATDAEYKLRKEIFADNKVRIAERNAVDPAAVYGINEFADLDPQEFADIYLSPFDPVIDPRIPKMEVKNIDAPSSINWVDHSPPVVNPVKNQGQCGSCWAFSAVSAVESAWALAGHPLVSLSESQVVDCTLNKYCIQYHNQQTCMQGCNGGLQPGAFDYMMAVGGLESEANYPYVPADGPCDFKSSEIAAHISNWTFVSTYESPSEQAVKEALVKGPVAIAADASTWQFYIGGVAGLSPLDCHGAKCGLDHGIVIEGYGAHGDHDVWYIRNSWGSRWGVSVPGEADGEKGYIIVAQGKNAFGVLDYVTQPIV